MELEKKIQEDIKSAMKEKNNVKLNAVRSIKSAILLAKTAEGGPKELEDSDIIKVAIVGKPNVGKSSLLNALLGEKIAIVSSKPQTTRTRIMGVLTEEEFAAKKKQLLGI